MLRITQFLRNRHRVPDRPVEITASLVNGRLGRRRGVGDGASNLRWWHRPQQDPADSNARHYSIALLGDIGSC